MKSASTNSCSEDIRADEAAPGSRYDTQPKPQTQLSGGAAGRPPLCFLLPNHLLRYSPLAIKLVALGEIAFD
jgi:hypothetical protein